MLNAMTLYWANKHWCQWCCIIFEWGTLERQLREVQYSWICTGKEFWFHRDGLVAVNANCRCQSHTFRVVIGSAWGFLRFQMRSVTACGDSNNQHGSSCDFFYSSMCDDHWIQRGTISDCVLGPAEQDCRHEIHGWEMYCMCYSIMKNCSTILIIPQGKKQGKKSQP